MKYVFAAAATMAALGTSATAGGIERTNQSVSIIFEEGSLVELSLGHVSPSISGVGTGLTPGASSGDMTDSYARLGFAYKRDFTEKLAFALIYEQPFGANVTYPSGTGYYAGGATAELKSNSLTGVLKYKFDNNVSVYGGLRYQTLSAEASGVPFVDPVTPASGLYSANSTTDGSVGYLVGVAYEKPEIALRVALTYNSAIDHDWSVAETAATTTPALFSGTSGTQVTTPQSVNLEVQSGIAQDTLAFGSIRWVDWTALNISPTIYNTQTAGGSLVSYENDTVTYTLGVGRRFNETWSGAVSVSHEAANGGFSANLGPKDGLTSVTLATTYKKDKMEVTGGISYAWIGDASTRASHLSSTEAGRFTDNSAVGVGLRIRYRF